MVDAETHEQGSRRREIARIALDAFLERGFAATSMSAVARAAGISKPALYHHFSSKEEMFVQALSEDVAEPLQQIKALADDPSRDPVERFAAALDIFYDSMVLSKVGKFITVISETSRTVPAVAQAFHDDFIMDFEDALEAVYRPAVRAGTLREMERSQIDSLVFGPLMSIAICAAIFRDNPALFDKYAGSDSRAEYLGMVLAAVRR